MRRSKAPRSALKVGLGLTLALGILALGILGPVDHLRLLLAQSCGDILLMPICVEIKSVPTLIRMSRWGLTPWARREATWLLGRRPDEAALETLRLQLAETSDPTLWGLALAGRYHTDKLALAAARPDMIIGAFESRDHFARASAAVGARALGDPSNAPRCAAALVDPHGKVRFHAVECLARLGPAPHLDALQQLAVREWESPVLGELAILAAQLDDPKAEALFTTAAKSLNAWGPKGRAVEALAQGSAPWCAARLEAMALDGDADAARLLAERSFSSPPAAPAAAAPPPGQ